MKRIKIISLILTLINLLFGIFGSGCIRPKTEHPAETMREPFETAYTIEEHKQRIYDLVRDPPSSYKRFEIVVYIMYSFNDYPEYFLVQRYCINGYNLEKNDYVYGYIYKDEYYLYGHVEHDSWGMWSGQSDKDYTGLNPYVLAGIPDDYKKYYGECKIFAWKDEEGKIKGYDVTSRTKDCKKYVYLLDKIVVYNEKDIEELKQKRYTHKNIVKKVERYIDF